MPKGINRSASQSHYGVLVCEFIAGSLRNSVVALLMRVSPSLRRVQFIFQGYGKGREIFQLERAGVPSHDYGGRVSLRP